MSKVVQYKGVKSILLLSMSNSCKYDGLEKWKETERKPNFCIVITLIIYYSLLLYSFCNSLVHKCKNIIY